MIDKYLKLEEFNNYSIYKFTPDIFNLFGKYYPEKVNLRRIIRFILALNDGYEIYSLVKNNEAIAYCTIQNGKCRRFDYTTENDIVVGPYVVMPNYRGSGLAKELISRVLKYKRTGYNFAYAYITEGNMASIRTCESLGFKYYKNAYVTKIKADVIATDDKNSGHIIMRLKLGDE